MLVEFELMQSKSINKKIISWFLIILLVFAWGVQKRKNEIKNAKIESAAELKLSEKQLLDTKLNTENIMRDLYHASVCNFKNELQPVTEVLANISQRKSIPPDLLSELKLFNDSAQYMAMDEKILLGKNSNLNSDERSMEVALKAFAKEINLKTAELEQGVITVSNPYFAKLNKSVTALVEPSCTLYESSHPEKSIFPNATPTDKKIPVPGSIDAVLNRISRQVTYDSICKLKYSGQKFIIDIQNAESNDVYKNSLLDTSKNLIQDLHYASFSFNLKGLYTPTPDEAHWSTDFEELISKLENYRYVYWSNSSKSILKSMKVLTNRIQDTGEIGCAEVDRLKRLKTN
jgi:hypothetical protein